ncbi:EAL domain-containing protein [Serpentinicella sp. ANB-PHB4]|uniref:EAL domain-containing protein n=1 Tax=Serpentinicella sp. ANB-PHB4 TaxID=3074076 RepID=UPI0028632F55|nr:EAL domain-containing protein [Serpentinicella sp. ANB-PHB4]MDR5659063.1 EAL domain-containing protein [Serpentinicella sp. ANB-PHB4]
MKVITIYSGGVVRNVHKDEMNQLILSGIISLAQSSKTKILAEGVETKEELDYLKQVGVDLVQGYYFAKPAEKPKLNISNY